MVLFKKPKLNNKRIIISGALALMLAFGIYSDLIPVTGQTVDELQRQKQEKQQKLNDINKKIAEFQKEINQRRKQANSLANEIATVNLEIAQTEAQIDATKSRIDVVNFEIADVTEMIVHTEGQIKDQKEVLKDLIGQINDLDQRSPLEVALENDNFTDFLDQMQYVVNIQERSQEVLGEVKKLKSQLEIEQASLKKHKADLDAYNQQLAIVEAGLAGQRLAKQQILDQTRGQERAYQRLLNEQEKAQEELEREMAAIEAEISRKLGNRRAPARKGLLAWPMDGTLTQGYGNTGFTRLGYTFHNGIDIAAAAGTPIYAVADGVIEDTGNGNGSYGNWVTIRHANITAGRSFISLYAHMSSYRVKEGQSVKAGDLVGFEGNTGNTTRLLYGPHRGYHIHFTLFDAEGYGVRRGVKTGLGVNDVPYGASYNPLDFL